MESVTYHLNIPEKENQFYPDLALFTSRFLNSRKNDRLFHVEAFYKFLGTLIHTEKKQKEEIYLEYLTMGVFMRKYGRNIQSSFGIFNRLLLWLYTHRNKIPRLKKSLDGIRGIFSTLWLTQTWNRSKIRNAGDFQLMIQWLKATGEFNEEADRLKIWLIYIQSLTRAQQNDLLKKSRNEAFQFEQEAAVELGIYTRNLEQFRVKKLGKYRYKENYIFCGRHEVEYHLNMFGAEILNRMLYPEFKQTTQRVVLLPTCMSRPKYQECRAKISGNKMICTACTVDCPINVKRRQFANTQTEVVLIPHASGFTKFLEHWKNQDITGLIGVACVLNLMKGGYEMQKLKIPSQCVFLDYCGCRKHWHQQGIATDLNQEQLTRMTSISA